MTYTKLSLLLFWNTVSLIILLVIGEGIITLKGYSTFSPLKEIPNIVVSPNGKYFQPDTLLGYKHLAGQYQIRLKDTFEFTTTHNMDVHRITSSRSKNNVPNNTPKIWMLGCSFTHGWSVNDTETFPWIIQDQLPEYTVENWGTSGYGSIHFYLQLKKAFDEGRHAEIVIINHADFHFERNSFSYARRRRVAKWNFLGDLNQPFASINSSNQLKINYSQTEYQTWPMAEYSALIYYLNSKFEGYIDRRNESNLEQITSSIFDKIHELCIENGTRLIITNVGKNPKFVENYCSQHKIQFIDISVDLALPKNTNAPVDWHPSAVAHKNYARKLLKGLNTCGFLAVNEGP